VSACMVNPSGQSKQAALSKLLMQALYWPLLVAAGNGLTSSHPWQHQPAATPSCSILSPLEHGSRQVRQAQAAQLLGGVQLVPAGRGEEHWQGRGWGLCL